MRDPTIPSPEDRKKLMFYDTPDRQTKLRIRCNFDGLSQSQFFRMILTGYIENDNLINDFIKKYKKKHNIQGQQKRDKIDRIRKRTEETKNKFTLGNEEIENIFDIIEMETDI